MRSNNVMRRSSGFSLIELLIVISIIGILAAVAIPQLQRYLKTGKETAAIQTLQNIHKAEATFYSTRGKYGNLDQLVADDLLNKNYGEGKTISGYTYTSTEVANNSFTVHADRAEASTAYRDFNITEKGDVYYVENKEAKGTVARGQGLLLSESEAADSKATPADKK